MKKWITLCCRWILGLIFLIAGLNGFVVFFGMDAFMPTSPKAMEFFELQYLLFLEKSVEVILGGLLLWNRFVPMALAALLPVIINIFFFHIFEDLSFLPLAIVLIFLEAYLLWAYRSYYHDVLKYKANPR